MKRNGFLNKVRTLPCIKISKAFRRKPVYLSIEKRMNLNEMRKKTLPVYKFKWQYLNNKVDKGWKINQHPTVKTSYSSACIQKQGNTVFDFTTLNEIKQAETDNSFFRDIILTISIIFLLHFYFCKRLYIMLVCL